MLLWICDSIVGTRSSKPQYLPPCLIGKSISRSGTTFAKVQLAVFNQGTGDRYILAVPENQVRKHLSGGLVSIGKGLVRLEKKGTALLTFWFRSTRVILKRCSLKSITLTQSSNNQPYRGLDFFTPKSNQFLKPGDLFITEGIATARSASKPRGIYS